MTTTDNTETSKIENHFKSVSNLIFSWLKIDNADKARSTLKDIPKVKKSLFYSSIALMILGIVLIIANVGAGGLLTFIVGSYLFGVNKYALPSLLSDLEKSSEEPLISDSPETA
jgi:hypothetical protein